MDANASRLLTSFWFEVSLIVSATVVAGSQRTLTANADAPTPPPRVIGDGAFQECSGLEIEMDVQEYQEGGRNNGVIRRAGRAKYPPIILRRGMFYAAERSSGAATAGAPDSSADNKADDTLWLWMQSIVNGDRPIQRYDGLIHVMSGDRTVRASWVFERGLPARIKGPELNGRTGEIAIEELHIAHEGLHLLPAGGTRA